MQLVLVGNFAVVRENYIEVIEHTKYMNVHARWIYGQHPTDAMIQSYIDEQEMYLFMDGKTVAGMTAITMYQGKDYHEVVWSQNLKDDEVASLHIFTVTPAYQGRGVSKRMMAEIISLAMEKGKKDLTNLWRTICAASQRQRVSGARVGSRIFDRGVSIP